MKNNNGGGFSNFSQIGKECPRCGEENDKCGMIEDSNFVMCRTDMGDSVEPKIDKNGWEYWPFQLGDGDKFSETYSAFSGLLSLSVEDKHALLSRGFTEEQIATNGYKTIPHRKGNEGMGTIVSVMDAKYTLTDVPGFYLKDETREANAQYKQTVIPVRNFAGRITQFVLRNNGASDGKKRSKYIMFSSDGKDEGGKAGQEIHFPLGQEKCGHELRVTEGILKADAAVALGDIYCIGLHGLSSRGLLPAIEMLGVSKIRLCLDIDWQRNKHVLNGLRRIYSSIADAGFDVVVEEWNESDGKGIDDVLLTKSRIWQMDKEDLEFLIERPHFDRSQWAYINKTSQFANITDTYVKMFDEKHFNNHFVKFKEEFAKEAKAAVKQFDSLTYVPKGEMAILENEFFNLNTWKDTGIAPNKGGGDLTVFHEHLEYIFPDERDRGLFLDWMANVVQHRGKKFSYAMLLHGEEGTGKTWMVHCLSLILGKQNTKTIANDYIHKDSNGMMQSRELLIINEVMASGRRDFMNKMKDYIDLKEITINIKYVPEYDMPFHSNWFMTTNYDDALLIDDKDRRYLILSSPAICGADKEADKRGDKLFRWSGGGKEDFPVQEGNISALHAFLMERKVKCSPFAKAPDTQAKRHMQEESLSSFEQFVKEGIEEKLWPFKDDLVCIEHVKRSQELKRFEKISPHKWGRTLRKFGAVQYGCKIDKDGKVIGNKQKIRMKSEKGTQRAIWVLRRKETYLNLSGPEIEELYVKRKSQEPEYTGGEHGEEPI